LASISPSTGSAGSGVLEDVFVDFFDSIGRATKPTAFDGRSDYDAFVAAGIPVGGLFTGAEDIKQPSDALAHGLWTFAMTTSATEGTGKGNGNANGLYDPQFKGDKAVR